MFFSSAALQLPPLLPSLLSPVLPVRYLTTLIIVIDPNFIIMVVIIIIIIVIIAMIIILSLHLVRPVRPFDGEFSAGCQSCLAGGGKDSYKGDH